MTKGFAVYIRNQRYYNWDIFEEIPEGWLLLGFSITQDKLDAKDSFQQEARDCAFQWAFEPNGNAKMVAMREPLLDGKDALFQNPKRIITYIREPGTDSTLEEYRGYIDGEFEYREAYLTEELLALGVGHRKPKDC